MCSKRLGPQGEVGDTVVFERLFVSPTPSGGWDRVGTNGEVGTGRHDERRCVGYRSCPVDFWGDARGRAIARLDDTCGIGPR